MAISTHNFEHCYSLVVGALSCRAWLQTSYWRDSETLFTHALAVTSNNDVALNNLGIIFLDKGQLNDAISKLQAAIDLRPENAPAHDNLAKALLKKGQVAEAMVHYRKFLELEPANVEARNTLGTALIQQGHVREAIDLWQESLEYNQRMETLRAILRGYSQLVPKTQSGMEHVQPNWARERFVSQAARFR